MIVKDIITAVNHTLVIDINVLNEKPGAHAVVTQRKTLSLQTACQVIQQGYGLTV